jgi:hypothetical protein
VLYVFASTIGAAMFDEFFGLPLHPFIVHTTVVVLPAVAMLAVAYVAVPSWRWLTRWPLALGAVGAPLLTWVTLRAGESLEETLGIESALIETHESRAEMLLYYTVAFAVVALVAAFALGGPSLLVTGAGSRRGMARPLQIGVGAALVVVSLLVLVQVVLTGDAGSRAVWDGVA